MVRVHVHVFPGLGDPHDLFVFKVVSGVCVWQLPVGTGKLCGTIRSAKGEAARGAVESFARGVFVPNHALTTVRVSHM